MNKFWTNLDDVFNDFGGWFGKPQHLMFNTNNTKDMMPSYFEPTDEGYKVTCRTVGIAPKDVKISLEDKCLHIEGKTKLDGYDYSTSYYLVIEDIINNIKNVKYKSENGITIIYLEIDKPKKKSINIEKID